MNDEICLLFDGLYFHLFLVIQHIISLQNILPPSSTLETLCTFNIEHCCWNSQIDMYRKFVNLYLNAWKTIFPPLNLLLLTLALIPELENIYAICIRILMRPQTFNSTWIHKEEWVFVNKPNLMLHIFML